MRLSVRVRVHVYLPALAALDRVRCFGARSILLLAAVFVLMVIPTLSTLLLSRRRPVRVVRSMGGAASESLVWWQDTRRVDGPGHTGTLPSQDSVSRTVRLDSTR